MKSFYSTLTLTSRGLEMEKHRLTVVCLSDPQQERVKKWLAGEEEDPALGQQH
jgi:hypothetical protein